MDSWIILCILMIFFSFCLVFYWTLFSKSKKIPTISPTSIEIKTTIEKKAPKEEELTAEESFKIAQVYQFGKFGIPKDLQASIHYYNISISKTSNYEHRSKCCYAIGDIYRNGSPPDAVHAIKYYLHADSEDAFMEIIKIYEHGLHPFYLPDKMVARKILNTILYDPISKQKLSIAFRQSISELSKELGNLSYTDVDKIAYDDREYKPLPTNMDVVIITRIADADIIIPTINQNTPLTQTRVQQAQTPDTRINQETRRHNQRNAQYDAIFDNLFDTNTNTDTNVLDRIPEQVIKNDSQNVHSSTINNAAKQTISLIEKSTPINHSFDNNVNTFLNSLNTTKQYELRKVLSTLNDTTHSRFDKSEKDVFNLVWSRINDPINSDRKQEMIDIFAQNLESGIEHGMVVCSTGKIMRMIGSLDAIDKENISNLRPEWAIKEEIAQTAANIRNNIVKEIPDDKKEAYEALDPTPEQQIVVENVTNTMKDKFVESVQEEYVKTNILTKHAADAMMAPYLESF